ncbi:hypothetical protein ABL78_2497 [Leptomonas seymouri]|uniref:Uncharacterized protein n=1 Tax=Leptomonas seymouri TaxID=5684 RepID=A0A0N1I611_LEPSE|nr:hypothetical protein ABL78_2497 [Leptomonas seymouri]|eukprot:KPI88378.1 hypothetical protein ABL78_2497 [Leptomonas seymouri]
MRGDFDFSPLVQSLRGAQQFFVGTDAVTVEGIAEPITCYREVLKSLLDHIRAHSTGATCTSAVMSPKVEKAVGTMCERWLNFSACLPSAWGWAWESAVHRPTSVAVAEAGPRRRRDSLSNLAIAVEEAGNRGAAGSPFWSPAQQVASALMVYLVQWSRQSAARRASCGDSAARSLAEAHSPAVIPPLPPRLAPPEDRPFDLVGVHACVLTALQEALSSRRNYSPAEADEEPAAWVQSLLECVALASLMRDEEVKSRALMSTFTCWGSTRHCGGRDTGSAEDAMRRVEQQLREGSWVLWYVLRVVGLMSWWDAVQPMLVPCGAPS